jgi:hypothetical protein
MSTIYREDYSLLEAEGWQMGSHWSELGIEGFYVRHTEHTGQWTKISHSRCKADSLWDAEKETFVSPCGTCHNATEALLDRISKPVSQLGFSTPFACHS